MFRFALALAFVALLLAFSLASPASEHTSTIDSSQEVRAEDHAREVGADHSINEDAKFDPRRLLPLQPKEWTGWTFVYSHWMEKASKKIRVVVLGGSGATGTKLINTLLANERVELVSNLGRRVYDTLPNNPKLIQHVIDFESFPAALNDPKLLKQYDVAFMTHGTTRAQAGSGEAFYHIDHDYAIEFAKICKNNLGVETYVLVTSGGANSNSWFPYLMTKGKIEEDTRALGFKRFLIYRPGFLKREKADRFWEHIASKIPFIPQVDLTKLSEVMLNEAIKTFDELKTLPDIAAAPAKEQLFEIASL